MSQRRRLTTLVAVLAIGAAAVLSAAQWVGEAADATPQLRADPTVAAPHGVLRPVDGRAEQLWGRTQRRLPRSVGDTTALAGFGVVVIGLAFVTSPARRRSRGLLLGAAHVRGPPLLLVP
jgi:hypothetical protein